MSKIRNIWYIFQGWTNDLLFKLRLKFNPKWEERLKICKACPTNVNGFCSKRKCDIIDNITICGCGCPINKRIKSDKPCPKKYWE